MDQLHQLSAQYNALWIETNQLYETWARQRGMSLYELLVILSIVELTARYSKKTSASGLRSPSRPSMRLSNADRQGMAGTQGFGAGSQKQETSLTPKGSTQAVQIAQALQEHEAQVWLRLGLDRAEQLIEHTALYNRHFREVSG